MPILCRKTLILLGLNFLHLTNFLIKAPPTYPYHVCQNATGNIQYRTNLHAAMSDLPNTNNGYGFYNVSVGQGIDTANAMFLCRGDVEPGMCRNCLNASIINLSQVCPNQSRAVIYFQFCLLKYSNESVFSIVDMYKDVQWLHNNDSAINKDKFYGALRPLLSRLRSETAGGNSSLKFAMDNTTGPNFNTIYALTQCIPNLSEQDCNDCLESEINRLPYCCDGKIGGIVLTPVCNIRYEIYEFGAPRNVSNVPILPTASPDSQPSRPPPPRGKRSNATRTVAIIITVIIAVILVACICIFGLLRRKRKHVKRVETQAMDISTLESLQYDYETVKSATNDFSESKKLGQGGFGTVYKAVSSGKAWEVKATKLDGILKENELMFKEAEAALNEHKDLVKRHQKEIEQLKQGKDKEVCELKKQLEEANTSYQILNKAFHDVVGELDVMKKEKSGLISMGIPSIVKKLTKSFEYRAPLGELRHLAIKMGRHQALTKYAKNFKDDVNITRLEFYDEKAKENMVNACVSLEDVSYPYIIEIATYPNRSLKEILDLEPKSLS